MNVTREKTLFALAWGRFHNIIVNTFRLNHQSHLTRYSLCLKILFQKKNTSEWII